jgi:hypothetical protein
MTANGAKNENDFTDEQFSHEYSRSQRLPARLPEQPSRGQQVQEHPPTRSGLRPKSLSSTGTFCSLTPIIMMPQSIRPHLTKKHEGYQFLGEGKTDDDPNILDRIHPSAVRYMINALAFDAEWGIYMMKIK